MSWREGEKEIEREGKRGKDEGEGERGRDGERKERAWGALTPIFVRCRHISACSSKINGRIVLGQSGGLSRPGHVNRK